MASKTEPTPLPNYRLYSTFEEARKNVDETIETFRIAVRDLGKDNVIYINMYKCMILSVSSTPQQIAETWIFVQWPNYCTQNQKDPETFRMRF